MKALQTDKKVLVAYFSAMGTTRTVAQEIAIADGGKLYEIVPAQRYTSADLNWHNQQSRSSLEMNASDSRPAIAGETVNLDDYDVVFIGYPIWWNLAPRVVNTFIESHTLQMPFSFLEKVPFPVRSTFPRRKSRGNYPFPI